MAKIDVCGKQGSQNEVILWPINSTTDAILTITTIASTTNY